MNGAEASAERRGVLVAFVFVGVSVVVERRAAGRDDGAGGAAVSRVGVSSASDAAREPARVWTMVLGQLKLLLMQVCIFLHVSQARWRVVVVAVAFDCLMC